MEDFSTVEKFEEYLKKVNCYGEYKKALSEIDIIISSMPEELSKKIPSNFKETVKKEKDEGYNPDVNYLVIENHMLPETVAILGLVYRDYLCSEGEREKLLFQEEKNLQRLNVQKDEFNYDDLFKRHEIKEPMQLVVVKEKWYQKVVDYFKRIIGIK